MPSLSWSTLLDFLDQPAVAIRAAERDDPPGIEARGLSTGSSARRRRQTRRVLTASLTYSIHRLDPLGALSGASNGSSDHLATERVLLAESALVPN
jgi:hypothetical protein